MEKDNLTKPVINISMVIVTFNRLEKLKKAIDSINCQKFSPKNLIIVNNGSTDKTKEYLDTLPKNIKVINNEENLGGSGGFYIGEQEALKHDADWVWISDDDAYLDNDVFDKLNQILSNIDLNVGAICTKVSTIDGIDFNHRRTIKKGLFRVKEIQSVLDDYSKENVEIDEFSYVGAVIRKNVLEEIGLVNKDFFIWYDDTEHSLRIRKKYKILLYPSLNIFHDCPAGSSALSWKNYYEYRNYAFTTKSCFGLWYYNFYKLKIRLKIILSRDKTKRKMMKIALKDVKKNKLGKSNIYYPGAKI